MIKSGPDETEAPPEEIPPCPRDWIELVGGLLTEKKPRRQLARPVEALGQSLRDRREREISAGILEDALFEAPWLTGQAEALRQQHDEMLAIIDRLLTDLRQKSRGRNWRLLFTQQFEELLAVFEEYEAGHGNLLRECHVRNDTIVE